MDGYGFTFETVSNGGCVNTEHWYWKHLDRAMPGRMLIGGHPIGWALKSMVNGKLMKDQFGGSMPVFSEKGFPSPVIPLNAASTYRGDKQMIIHTIPPHLPFISPTGVELQVKLKTMIEEAGFIGGGPTVYTMIEEYGRQGHWDELRQCYRESIAHSLLLMEPYMKDLPHPIIITADHGEMIGEFTRYNHNAICPAITNVPWLKLWRA
jgi:hypothetical protein